MPEHNYCCGSYKGLVWLGHFIAPFFLLFLRLFWGLLFFYAGLAKFGIFDETAASFAAINIPWPLFSAYLVTFVETLGGLFLIIGFLSRFAALLLAITMGTALWLTNYDLLMNLILDPSGFLAGATPFTYLVAALVVLCFGPGLFSVDYLLERFYCKNRCR